METVAGSAEMEMPVLEMARPARRVCAISYVLTVRQALPKDLSYVTVIGGCRATAARYVHWRCDVSLARTASSIDCSNVGQEADGVRDARAGAYGRT